MMLMQRVPAGIQSATIARIVATCSAVAVSPHVSTDSPQPGAPHVLAPQFAVFAAHRVFG
jgi:hypothetical protein